MASVAPTDCVISTVTLYELLTGVEKCENPSSERSKVAAFESTVAALPFDSAAAQRAATTRATLESQGLTIGPYDLLIAGQALASGLTIVTANVGEFSRVPGLAVEDWQSP